MNLLKFFRLYGARKRRDLELFPPYWLMDVRVLSTEDNWRHVRIRLPLNMFNRNMGGTMFGGAQAALADPIPALACARIFPEYAVWTRDLTLDFRLPGSTELELRFDFSAEQEAKIRRELASRGRATPLFEFGYYLADGTECTHVSNRVAIRPKNYLSVDSAAPE